MTLAELMIEESVEGPLYTESGDLVDDPPEEYQVLRRHADGSAIVCGPSDQLDLVNFEDGVRLRRDVGLSLEECPDTIMT